MAKIKGIGLASPSKTVSVDANERRWRAESDLRTLKDAEQIRSDPGRHADAKRMAKSEVKALQRVATGKKR